MNKDFISGALFVSKERADEIYKELVTIMNLVVGAANTVAGKAMFDAINRVKETPLYCGNVKRYLNWAASLYYKYEKNQMRNFGDAQQLYYDYLDYVEEDIQEYVDIFRISVKSAFDRKGLENSDLKSYVETACNLLGYACHLYDVQIENARKKAPYIDFDALMRPARLTGVFKRFKDAEELLCKPGKGVIINLNDDKNCVLAFRTIEIKITSEDFLNNVGYKALKINPEKVATVEPEDIKMLETKYGKL